MAEINNFTEITENFDTIKTLLNSIRAQGILNTSDVDKILMGINNKLEKINTDEEVDLIKTTLTDLKQNVEERHGYLISKFGAIESLFATLLKNSADSVKSSEMKELFDIIATNLSVFSREVVNQKDTLTDITLRIDAMRSDDSQKKDIIKNITILKSDLERLSNGFDSIVLSLNENFKTLVKTLSGVDQSEAIGQFGKELEDIVNSSNTILSAIEMLDKKNVQTNELIKSLATQEDMNVAKKWISDLATQNHELAVSLDNLNDKYKKVDTLAEKIDASVSIIAGLKAAIADNEDEHAQSILTELKILEAAVVKITDNQNFDEFSRTLQTVFKEKISNFIEENVTKTLDNISSSADVLSTTLQETQYAITNVCEKSFSSVLDDVSELKSVILQLDKNNISTNNAVYANITDRLSIFESNLKKSLEKQEESVTDSSKGLLEQITNIKNLASVIEYKMDASVIQLNDSKREFSELKNSVQEIVALDFVGAIKDLKADLCVTKEDLSSAVESSTTDLSDKFTSDLYGKYELLINKLDSVETDIKQVQTTSLDNVKSVLDNISSSIMDVLSYVGAQKGLSTDVLDFKFSSITEAIKENSLNYVENVRDIVDTIKVQVENNIEQIKSDNAENVTKINSTINQSTEVLRKEIKSSYDKLLEVQDKFDEINDALNVNNINLNTNIGTLLASSDEIKSGFDAKLAGLKNSILDRISEFKQEFTCENADKISELKFASESMYSKCIQNADEMKADLREELAKMIGSLKLDVEELTGCLSVATDKIEGVNTECLTDMGAKFANMLNEFRVLEENISSLNKTTSSALASTLAKILDNFVSLKSLLKSFNDQNAADFKLSVEDIKSDFSKLDAKMNLVDNNIDEDFTRQLALLERNFEVLTEKIGSLMDEKQNTLEERISTGFFNISDRINNTMGSKLEQYKLQVEDLFAKVSGNNDEQADFIKQRVAGLSEVLNTAIDTQNKTINEQLQTIARGLKSVLDDNFALTTADYNVFKGRFEEFSIKLEALNLELVNGIKAHLSDVVKFVDSGLDVQAQEVNSKFDEISAKIQGFSSTAGDLNNEIKARVQNINDTILDLKGNVSQSLGNTSNMIIDSLQEASKYFSTKQEEIASSIILASADIKGDVRTVISTDLQDFETSLNAKISRIETSINQMSASEAELIAERVKSILSELNGAKDALKEHMTKLQYTISADLGLEVNGLYDKISTVLKEHSQNYLAELANSNSKYLSELDAKTIEFKASFETLNERLNNDEVTQMSMLQSHLKELSNTFNVLIDEAKTVTKTEVSAISETLISNSRVLMEEVENSIEEKVNSMLATSANISAGELQTIETFANKILEKVDIVKQNSLTCKDLINEFTKKELDIISSNIEKETDIIVKDLIEQFELMRDFQKDELSNLSTLVGNSIEDYIYNFVEDLKSHIDIKTDSSILNHKLDNLRNDLTNSVENVLENMDKFVTASVFNSGMSEIKTANEILLNSMADRLNLEVQEFITENVSDKFDEKINGFSNKFDEKLNLFDKKFIDTVVDKYEEIKLISTNYNNSFNAIETSVNDIVSKFVDAKDEINQNITSVLNGIDHSINELSVSFADLKSQILNKSFDEAFQASINNQVESIENLVKEQFGYLEDISELCCNNLPEITEMNTIIKFGVQDAISDLALKVDLQSDSLEKDLNNLKADIITQFLNIFNQISFVAEQEEILDFIQTKHSELITILSHIVTTVDGVETVKDNLAVVDNKVDSLKEELELIKGKINSVISSNGDVDYVYSLQDLESDIANLRLVLNEMKENNDSENLATISEDIVSISTRINKLILASDESTQTLQDSLQDFKLVINDLDERTRNFAHEAGIERIDDKLGSIHTMMQNGAKTNQVFNQVFEYLAEWVDKAGEQISTISDKVVTLDEIGQIKVMLEDLKSESEDNSETNELIEALSNVFEKQAKKIASLEAKLDRVIVETTISNKSNKIDMTPFEDTLNRFLVAIGDKMAEEQSKIKTLEAKLEEAMSKIDPKDTAQLTKKVGGMDRQIAKLNKSIEKIASHVVER